MSLRRALLPRHGDRPRSSCPSLGKYMPRTEPRQLKSLVPAMPRRMTRLDRLPRTGRRVSLSKISVSLPSAFEEGMRLMTSRTTRKTVTFRQPFALRGVDGTQPPGAYDIDTDEE